MHGHRIYEKRHAGVVNSVSFSPDSNRFASGSDDCNVKLWWVGNQLLNEETYKHDSAVTSVSFSPNGQWLASGCWDGSVKLWSLTSGKCVATIEGCNNGPIRSVAWQETAEGYPMLAIGGEDKTVSLWQIKQEDDSIRVILRWTSYQAKLTAKDASITAPNQASERLSSINAHLLEQRGAVISSE